MRRREFERVQHAARVAEASRPGEGARLLDLCRARKAALPEHECAMGMAADLRVVIAVERRVVAVLILAVDRQPILGVLIATAEIALMEQAGPVAVMCLQQKPAVALAPRL